MAKVQYPNPKFWKAKDNIEWKKQGENLKEVMGIFGGMLKEVDWKAFGKKTVEDFKADGVRVKGEFKDFMALDNAEEVGPRRQRRAQPGPPLPQGRHGDRPA